MKITIDTDFNSAIKICKKALDALEINIDEINTKEKFIFASTKSGLLSWGEDIELSLNVISQNRTEIRIFSEAKAQLVTWGKNDDNVLEIHQAIKRISKSNR